MEEKIITVYGKNYKVLLESEQGTCYGCAVYTSDTLSCYDFADKNEGNCQDVIFKEVTEPKVQQEALVCPPIGIIPLVNHNAMRLNALMDTLQRYAEAGTHAKVQWVQEVKSLIEYERSLTREALDKVPFKL